MKVTLERSNFLKALGHVQNVVERRNTIPILANVLIRAENGEMSLTATDLDMEVSETLAADVDVAGALTVSAGTIYEIVRRLPDGSQILLEQQETRVKITAGKSEFALSILPESDFPTIQNDDEGTSFTMPAMDLTKLIDKTKFAMSMDETRYYLCGVYLHPHLDGGSSLRAVSTDGHRLARVDVPLPAEANAMAGVILPRKAVMELRRLLDDADEDVQVTIAEAKARFKFNKMVLTTKLIDGTFPDYARVIPPNNDREMIVDNADFSKAVERVSTVATDKIRSIKLILGPDHVKLMVNNPEMGSANEEISVDYKSEELEIGFNAKYLTDVAREIDGKDATFLFSDPSSPCIITDTQEPNALYVLMPLRV